jgi:hypothetical protein
MALNINNTTTGPLLDPFKLVKITKDNISDYPGIDAKFIGYNLFVNETRDIATEYKDVLGRDLVDAATGLPNPAKIYEQVQKDIGRSKMSINDVQLQNAFESNKTKFDALETSATLEEFRENLTKIFPGISVLNNQAQLEAIYNDEAFKKLIPFIYSIYNRFGITDNTKILEYMTFLQQGSAGSITNLFFQIYSIQPSDDQYVGRLNTSNNPPEPEKINAGDFSGKALDGAMYVSETIKENTMNGIQINAQLFTSYANVDGDSYIFSAINAITYIDYSANNVYLLMGDPIWCNESVHKAYDLIKQIDTSAEINQHIMWYMYEIIFKEYKNPQIQPLLVYIYSRFLTEITDTDERTEIYDSLENFITSILKEPNEDVTIKVLTEFNDLLKTYQSFKESMMQSMEMYNATRLKQFQMWLKQVIQTSYNKTLSMTPEDEETSIELGKSAIVWVNKVDEWANKNSIAEAQAAVEQIQQIVSNLDALAKLYNNKSLKPDDPRIERFERVKNIVNHIAKLVNAALNVALSIVIIRAIRQSNGIGSRVDVVDSVLKAALDSIRQAGTQVQTGGADGDNKDETLKQAETKAKDLYDIAMVLLNINAEVMEEAAKSNPVIVNDRSILANTLTILMNTKIPGKRILKYDPKMTIPGVNSSYVCFDPRVKLKQSIVNNVQPTAPIQYGGMFPFTQTATTSAAQNDAICMQFFRRNEFNSLLLRTLNESPQEIYSLTEAKEMGITDNNIQVTLDTLFKHGNVMYIQGAPYTINLYDWVYGDWQIDTRPNITLPQQQIPIITPYAVIIPNRSSLAMFEKEAKRERDTIPADAQKGDALESGSKIRKAIRSVLSPVTQNVKVNVTPNDIVKPISTWALTELLEQQKRNKKLAPVSVPARKSTIPASVGPVSAKQYVVVPGPAPKSTTPASVGPVSAQVSKPVVPVPAPVPVQTPTESQFKSVVPVPAPAPAPSPESVAVPAPAPATPTTELSLVSTPESALVPAPGSALVPAPGSALVPAPGSALVPAPGSALVPAPGSALVPAPTSALIPAPVSVPGLETELAKRTGSIEENRPAKRPRIPAVVTPLSSPRTSTAPASSSGYTTEEESNSTPPRTPLKIRTSGNTTDEDATSIESGSDSDNPLVTGRMSMLTPVKEESNSRPETPLSRPKTPQNMNIFSHVSSVSDNDDTSSSKGFHYKQSGGGEKSLIEAIKNNNLRDVEDELKRDPSLVNAKDEYGNTPLHIACKNDDEDIALLLLKYNANATIQNKAGKTPLNVCETNQLCIDLITNIVKRDLPKSTSNRNADVVVNDNDDSIKKSLSYYLKDPQKTEAKNSYYVVVDLDLHPGTSISTAQKLRMQCARVFDNIQEARADIKGVDYVPQEMTIPEAVPIPSAKTRTRKNANRIKGGRTKRHKNKGRKSKQTRKNTRVKRRRNSRRRAKK